jgi:glucosamine--fructose-6-phosphate aminotransferase (isomerizing)
MITREAAGTLITHAGPEIGVASTKAFTGQLTALFLVGLYLAQVREAVSAETSLRLVEKLLHIPVQLEEILRRDAIYEDLAKLLFRASDFLYLGRGIHFPIALEGALKLKEISYIHAEGYPAAEMKHGPIALVDENTPSIFLVPRGSIFDKVMSNLEEVKARGGPVIAIASEGDDAVTDHIASLADEVIMVPDVPEYLQPLVTVVPLQLLAYHIAVLRGCDVDKPRNLAKSVTVE